MLGSRPWTVAIAGVPIRAPRTWLALVAVLTAITINAMEPSNHRPLWYVAAILAVIGCAASLLAHDVAHAVAARRTSAGLRSLSPPLFGALSDDVFAPANPRADAWVAAAGPVASVLLTALFGLGWLVAFDGDSLAAGTLGFLALANLAIASASLMPGFPFDGGRIFRAFAWYLTDDLIAGTRVAAAYGQFIAMLGVFAAVFMLSLGEPYAVWGAWALLAFWTVNRAGRDGFTRTLWRETGRRFTIDDAGLANSRRIAAGRTIDDAIDDLLHGVVEGPMLVAEDGEVIGIVRLSQIRRIPRAIWTERAIRDASQPLAGLPRIASDAPLIDLVDLFDSTRSEIVLVERNGRITGAADFHVTSSRIRERIRADRLERRRKPT
jgi:Zn-dependent protease